MFSTFHQYVFDLPPEERRAVLAAERRYLAARRASSADGLPTNPEARAFIDIMEGWAELPAGALRRPLTAVPRYGTYVSDGT